MKISYISTIHDIYNYYLNNVVQIIQLIIRKDIFYVKIYLDMIKYLPSILLMSTLCPGENAVKDTVVSIEDVVEIKELRNIIMQFAPNLHSVNRSMTHGVRHKAWNINVDENKHKFNIVTYHEQSLNQIQIKGLLNLLLQEVITVQYSISYRFECIFKLNDINHKPEVSTRVNQSQVDDLPPDEMSRIHARYEYERINQTTTKGLFTVYEVFFHTTHEDRFSYSVIEWPFSTLLDHTYK